jgi:hypothetical protein
VSKLSAKNVNPGQGESKWAELLNLLVKRNTFLYFSSAGISNIGILLLSMVNLVLKISECAFYFLYCLSIAHEVLPAVIVDSIMFLEDKTQSKMKKVKGINNNNLASSTVLNMNRLFNALSNTELNTT